ncbi:ashwin [Cyclopterus lumpus]|uniref:ashwin n=1 Tax=Cyclopterus lumpus TaxID=8103 RepID=UPI00148721E6|nr:ashwin [Cyclopterus lumpus]
MAASTEQGEKPVRISDVDVLLHPELLSHEFMRLILREKHVGTGECESRDRLTELYLRHVIPRPQRTLPDSRWGKRMEKIRGRRHTPAGHGPDSSGNNHNRKRPLIVFDGSSSGPLKVKKPEGATLSTGTTDRLKPPPAANLPCKLSGNASSSSSSSSSIICSSDAANLKREAIGSDVTESPEVKKKIHHVTWP